MEECWEKGKIVQAKGYYEEKEQLEDKIKESEKIIKEHQDIIEGINIKTLANLDRLKDVLSGAC